MCYQFETETDGTKKSYVYKKFRYLHSFNKEKTILTSLKQDFQEGDDNDPECLVDNVKNDSDRVHEIVKNMTGKTNASAQACPDDSNVFSLLSMSTELMLLLKVL